MKPENHFLTLWVIRRNYMRKFIYIFLTAILIPSFYGCSSADSHLGGFYQSEVKPYPVESSVTEGNGSSGDRSSLTVDSVQILIQKKDNKFTQWINNREVDNGTYTKIDDNSYNLKSSRQDFEIELNKDNSFEITIPKINDGSPVILKNTSLKETAISFNSYDDTEEYKSLLD